jgi:type VI secretion system secreted protein Hcp
MSGPFDIYLKLDGIQGESLVRGHEKEIVVLSIEQAIDATILTSGGGGSSVGKTTFSGLRFRKPLDKGSIPIMLACASGKHIKSALFSFRRGGTNFDFYTIGLEDVLVTHTAQRAGDGAQYPLSFDALSQGTDTTDFLEDITLRYKKIRWTYSPIGPNGSAATKVTGGWDVAANKKI